MAKQILNRREPIYAEELPAEIADTSGYIEATDYATDTAGGTVKVDDAYGVELTAAGKLRGTVETAVNYAEASNNLLVSKGTLDNVLAAQPGGGGCVDLFVRSTELSNGVEYDLSADAADCKVVFVFTFDTDYPNITGFGNCNFAFVPEATPYSSTPEYSIVTVGLSTNPGCQINLTKTKFKMSNGSSRFQIQRIVGLK